MNSKTAEPTTITLVDVFPRFLAAIIDTFVAWQLFHVVSAIALPATTQPTRTSIDALIAGMFFLVNIWLLVARGQTFGKLITGIQVVDYHDNRLLPFFRIFVLRHNFLLPLILTAILYPGIISYFLLWMFMNLDAAPIFLTGRRCVHDYVACSKVVRFDPLRSHWSPGSQIEQHEVFEDMQSKPHVNWQLARLEKRVSMLLALAGQEGDKEAAIQKLAPTGLTAESYFEKTVEAIRNFAETATDEDTKASASKLMARVNAIEKHL